jgi:hypothetical protein
MGRLDGLDVPILELRGTFPKLTQIGAPALSVERLCSSALALQG